MMERELCWRVVQGRDEPWGEIGVVQGGDGLLCVWKIHQALPRKALRRVGPGAREVRGQEDTDYQALFDTS